VVDISERKHAEERQKLLIGELNHRIQNLFAVVQAVATNSLSEERPLASAREVFLDRLDSLARAYSLLTEQAWQGAPMKQILQAELSAFSERVDLDGPDVMVRQASAQSFALLFHELATNAVKYGALSVPEGRIAIRWGVDKGLRPAVFSFSWQEAGGPAVGPPTRTGFGRKVIEDTARRLGKYRIDYAPEGLKCQMEAPLDKVGWTTEESPRPF
jgi:two-component sensor histidine kinase